MHALPVKGSAEIIPTEGSDFMQMLMDRIETVAKFSPTVVEVAPVQVVTEVYVGRRRAAE